MKLLYLFFNTLLGENLFNVRKLDCFHVYSSVLIFLSNTFSHLNFSYSWKKLSSEMHFQRMFFYRIFMLSFYLRNMEFYINILKHRIKLIVNNIIRNKQKLISEYYKSPAKVNII